MSRASVFAGLCLSLWFVHAFVAAEPLAAPLAELRVLARTDGGKSQGAIGPGARLHKGDELRLEVKAMRKSYVHLIHIAPNGVATLLYRSEPTALKPGQVIHLPGQSQPAYLMDDDVGEETIALVATEAPVAVVNKEYAELIRSVAEQHRVPAASRALLQRQATMCSGATAPTQASRAAPSTPAPRSAPAPTTSAGPPNEGRCVPGIHDLEGPMRGFEDARGKRFVVAPDASGIALATLRFDHIH